jgi:hypothetical protein
MAVVTDDQGHFLQDDGDILGRVMDEHRTAELSVIRNSRSLRNACSLLCVVLFNRRPFRRFVHEHRTAELSVIRNSIGGLFDVSWMSTRSFQTQK